MRGLALGLVLCAAACTTDPCDSVAGSCLGLRITDGPELDQLQLFLQGVVSFVGQTPPTPGPLQRPPLVTAIALPEATGAAVLIVQGRRAGVEVGSAQRVLRLVAGQQQTVELSLAGPGSTDLGGGFDLAPTDGASADLASGDLSSVDLFGADLAGTDLAGTDLPVITPPPPTVRHVFLLSARTPPLGTLAQLDQACTVEAHASTWATPTSSFAALLGYTGLPAPSARFTPTIDRMVRLPSGAAISTDAAFFTDTHLGAIDELAAGTKVPPACVWSYMTSSGAIYPSSVGGDCGGWAGGMGGSTLPFAYTGQTYLYTAGFWAAGSVSSCVGSCYVYCIEL